MTNRMDAARSGNGQDVEVFGIPKPPIPISRDPKIVDPQGNTVKPATPSIMARFDAKASEKVELSRGTLWAAGTVLILAGVVFSYGSSIIGWARDDESQRVKMANIERQVEEMRKEMTALSLMLQEQRVKDAEKRGYELKAAEGSHSK